MVKQRLEGHFRNELKKYIDKIWFIKLQTLPLAHTRNPADFLILGKNKNILVECKECSGNSFSFDRWTQREDMLDFNRLGRNKSYLLISFWKGRRNKSLYYLLESKFFNEYINNVVKKSSNIGDLNSIQKSQNLEEIAEFLVHL